MPYKDKLARAASRKRYRLSEKGKEKNKTWRQTEKGRAVYIKQNFKMKMIIHKHYSPELKCMCICGCKVNVAQCLTIDHINNDGAEHKKELGRSSKTLYRWIIENNFPPMFQVLCFNCNCGRAVNKGPCPFLVSPTYPS